MFMTCTDTVTIKSRQNSQSHTLKNNNYLENNKSKIPSKKHSNK